MWKKITGIAIVVIALITSGFVLEDRYNNQKDHDKDLVHASEIVDNKIEKLDTKVAVTLQQMQKSNDYNHYSRVLEDLNAQIYKLRQWLRQNPNDMEAREDYENLKKNRDKVKERLDSLMRVN